MPLNVLMLMVDDLRPELGAYGSDWLRTPHIDQLAERSVLFTEAFAAVANCAPSRASILTGLRPRTHGVLDLKTHIRDVFPNVITLPQHFRNAGYLAVSYGKINHQFLDDALSWSPQSEFPDHHDYRGKRGRAWQRAGGFIRGFKYNQYHEADNVRKQEYFRSLRKQGSKMSPNRLLPPMERGTRVAASAYTDHLIASSAIAALRVLLKQRRPWFLAVGFIRPHLPFNAPEEFFTRVRRSSIPQPAPLRPPPSLSKLTARHLRCGDGELFDYNISRRGFLATSRKGRHLAHAYAACVSFVDMQVGRVLDVVRSELNHSLVVFLGDHGFKTGIYGGWGKHTLMREDTRVPLLVSAPGFLPKRVIAPVELIDLYPTLTELAGLASPSSHRLEGRSLVPLMRPLAPKWRIESAAAFSQWPLAVNGLPRCMGYSVRVHRWAFIQWTADDSRGHPTGEDVSACAQHFDLLALSHDSSGLRREVVVVAKHNRPELIQRLRALLSRTFQLPASLRIS